MIRIDVPNGVSRADLTAVVLQATRLLRLRHCLSIENNCPSARLEVTNQDLAPAAANLAPIIDENALTPVAVAAGLGNQQMEQSLAVAIFASRHARFEHLLVEERAQLLHWPHEPFIAFHPRNVVGPTPPLHLEARVLLLQLPDHIGKLLGTISGLEMVPNPRLKHWLQRR